MVAPVGFSNQTNTCVTVRINTESNNFNFHRISDLIKVNAMVVADNNPTIAFVGCENGYIYRAERNISSDDNTFDTWELVQKFENKDLYGAYKSTIGFNFVGEDATLLYVSNANAPSVLFANGLASTQEDMYFYAQDFSGYYSASKTAIYKFGFGIHSNVNRVATATGFTSTIFNMRPLSRFATSRLFICGSETNGSVTRGYVGYYNFDFSTFTRISIPSSITNETIVDCNFGGNDRMCYATSAGKIVEVGDYTNSSTTSTVHTFNESLNIKEIMAHTIDSVYTYFFCTDEAVYSYVPSTSTLRLLQRIESPHSLAYSSQWNRIMFATRNGFFVEGIPQNEVVLAYTTNGINITHDSIEYVANSAIQFPLPKITDALTNTSNNVQFFFDANDESIENDLLNNHNIVGQRITVQIHEVSNTNQSSRRVNYFSGVVTNIELVQGSAGSKEQADRKIVLSCESIEEVLKRSAGGRFTTRDGMRRHYPLDASFDNVAVERDTR